MLRHLPPTVALPATRGPEDRLPEQLAAMVESTEGKAGCLSDRPLVDPATSTSPPSPALSCGRIARISRGQWRGR